MRLAWESCGLGGEGAWMIDGSDRQGFPLPVSRHCAAFARELAGRLARKTA